MRVLVATRLNSTEEEMAEADLARTAIRKKGLETIMDAEVDWVGLFAFLGGRDAAYDHMAKQHDHIALIEGWDEEHGFFISRGQHSLALRFREHGKSASVWRTGTGARVVDFSLLTEDWAGPYARAEIGAEEQ